MYIAHDSRPIHVKFISIACFGCNLYRYRCISSFISHGWFYLICSTVHFNLYFNQHLTTSNYLSLYYTIQYSQIAAHFPYLIMLFMLFPLFSGRRVSAFVRSFVRFGPSPVAYVILLLFVESQQFSLLVWANINGESNSLNGWACNALQLNMHESLFTSTIFLYIFVCCVHHLPAACAVAAAASCEPLFYLVLLVFWRNGCLICSYMSDRADIVVAHKHTHTHTCHRWSEWF